MRYLIAVALSLTLLACSAQAGDTLEVGSAAPGFKLQDQNGDWHDLQDYHGKWLALYFYPKDDTPGCTTQACSIRDNIYAFKAIGAEIVGISVDDVESHQEFSSKYKLPFTILADVGGKTSASYGVLRDYKLMQIASRQTFLINPDGTIVKHYPEVDPDTHTELVLTDLKAMMEADSGADGAAD